MWHQEKPREKHSISDAFHNLIAACSQAELNSRRHFLFTVKMHLDMQQITCSSGVFSAKPNEKNLLKFYCLLINTVCIIAVSSN